MKRKLVETNNKRMIERYREINRFRFSLFKVTNHALPNEVRENPILSGIILSKLKEVKEEIENDIDNLSIDMIDIADILGERELEVSEIIARDIMLFDLIPLREKYEIYLRNKKRDEIYPLKDRKKKAEELRVEIEKLNATIESLEEVEPNLIFTQKEKLIKLEKDLKTLEETFNSISLGDIKANVLVRLHGYLGNILNDIDSKIDFIERNMA